MKKTFLLLSLVTGSFLANAQTPFTLTGLSYTQNFDGLSSGLPSGWGVYTDATSSSIGIPSTSYSGAPGIFADTISSGSGCGIALVFNEGFKNYPSAQVVTKDATCAAQKIITNRALGVRQKGPSASPNWDPGPAMVFKIANTTTITNLQLDFYLQSLDTTSGKTTIWTVDYATGTTPTSFTPATTSPAVLSTGNFLFSNTHVTVNFGTALNNQTSNVWIRLVALTAASGPSGARRASTAIDDFHLTYANSVSVSNVASQPITNLTVLGNSTSDNVTFAYSADEAGDFSLGIYDITARKVYTKNLDVKTGEQQMTVTGLNLASGLYIAKMTNGISSTFTKFVIN